MISLSMHIFGKGERVPMLLDARGIPLFYPTLFATSQLRNSGRAVNTISNQLRDIIVFLRWQASQDPARDIEVEFANGKFLTLSDIVAIRDFASLDMRRLDEPKNERTSPLTAGNIEGHIASVASSTTIGSQQHYNRLTTIADYLAFTASAITQHRDSESCALQISRMATLIRKHRPRGMALRRANDPREKSPPTQLVERFMAAIAVDAAQNPFRDPSVRLRNAIIFALFQYTGMRRGELLSLRVDQIDFGDEPLVWVRRNQDDPLDDRRYQPSSKTKERPMPIPEGLAKMILGYVMNHRSKLSAARKHPYLFVTHRAGAQCGRPISISSLGKTLDVMRSVDTAFCEIHPHSLRHHFNYELSVAIDAHNSRARRDQNAPNQAPITESRELDIRAFLNGHWSKASSGIYNTRHVREASDKAIRTLQLELGKSVRCRKIDE